MKIKALLQYVTIWTVLSPCFSGYLFAAQMNALWTTEAGVYAPLGQPEKPISLRNMEIRCSSYSSRARPQRQRR